MKGPLFYSKYFSLENTESFVTQRFVNSIYNNALKETKNPSAEAIASNASLNRLQLILRLYK
jgi:mevalonate kinase